HNNTITGPGQRVFDVLLEDALVFDDFDILTQTVHNTAITRSVVVEVTDGALDFDLVPITSVAIIRGIEILETDTGGPDTTAPVITLVGDAVMTLELGDTFTEPGYSATDNVDGDITANVVVAGDTVDPNT